MAMDYGPEVAPNPVRHMGYYAVLAAQRTLAQLRAAGFPNAKIGITAMIGVNDVPEEIFTISDATRVVNFAIQTAYIGLLSFWSINRDVNDIYAPLYMSSQIVQTPFDFAKAFYRLEYQHTSAL